MKDKVITYLQQQKELFGPLLYVEPSFTVDNHVLNHEEPLHIQAETMSLSINPNWHHAESLPILYQYIHNCQECSLGSTRNSFVFGVGNPQADILIIGEAPGADEDAKGEPFVGAAGQLLTKILQAIGFTREEVYIANIIKCRPPNNRRPEKSEINSCEPYLQKQIELIKPVFILALGLTAVNTLLKNDHKMQDIRGKILNYHGVNMIATYHPAALLRNPNWKKPAWDDVQMLKNMYEDWKKNNPSS